MLVIWAVDLLAREHLQQCPLSQWPSKPQDRSLKSSSEEVRDFSVFIYLWYFRTVSLDFLLYDGELTVINKTFILRFF